MEYSAILLENILMIFLLMMTGFALVKLGVMGSEHSNMLAKLSVYVLIPCTVINSFQTDFSQERFRDMLYLLLVGVIANLLFMLVAKLLERPLKLNGVERASVIFSNTGSLVFPLIAALFGDGMIALGTAYSLVQNMIIWSYGQFLLCGEVDRAQRPSYLKMLCNPSLIAVGISLVLFFGKIALPGILRDTVRSFSGAMTPISMMAIGMAMGGIRIHRLLNRPRAFLIAVLRLLLCPLLALFAFKLLNLGSLLSDRNLLLISMLAAAAPSAVTIVNIMQFHGMDSDEALSINIASDILCLATMPLVIILSQMMLI